MIAIIDEPYNETESGVPVSDCLKWTLQPDDGDVVLTPGSAATVVVTFPISLTTPANGTPFTLWGYVFTVDDSQPYTSTSFDMDSTGLIAGGRFGLMLESNLFFRRAISVAYTIDGTDLVVTVTWNECGEQPRFGGPSMELSALTDAGATVLVTNGVSAVYNPGYKLVTRLLRVENEGLQFTEVTRLEALDPNLTCTGADQIDVDYMADAKMLLYPILPELSATSYNLEPDPGFGTYTRLHKTGFFAAYVLEYGWIFRDDCLPISGTFKRTDPPTIVCNMAFPTEDIYNIRRYWPDHVDGLPPGQSLTRLLTTRPPMSRICHDSFIWMWYLNWWQGIAPTAVVARFSVVDHAGLITVHTFNMSNAEFYLHNFNVSPGFLVSEFSIDLDDVASYIVTAWMVISGEPAYQTEAIEFLLNGECCGDDSTDVYFLNPAGGIDTMSVDIVQRDVIQEGTEINVAVPCGTNNVTASKYGGRTLSALRAYDKVTIMAREVFSPELQQWFADFKRSPHRWIRVQIPTGEYIAKKFIPDPGSIQIFRDSQNLELTATGYFQDIPLQSTTEQPF